MDNVERIRDDVVIEMDVGREMAQYVAEKIAEYIKETGEHPASIAFVLIGPDRGDAETTGYSWSPGDENRSRLQCCAVASAVLMKRALGI